MYNHLQFSQLAARVVCGLLLLCCFSTTNVWGQCTNGVLYISTFTPTCPSSTPQQIASCQYAGEYSTPSVTVGNTYTFSSSVATDFITVTSADGLTSYVFGTERASWTATFSGTVRVYTHLNPACGTANVCRNLFVQCGGCLNAPSGQYPSGSFTPGCTGSAETITVAAWTGEYSLVNVTNGGVYTFRSSVVTDHITISNATGTAIYAFGVGGTAGIVFTASFTGQVRFYLHNNAACATETISRTRSVQCSPTLPVVLVPFTGNNSVCGTDVNLQDHAGAGQYANFANGYTILYNGGANTITITGTYTMEACCDRLSIYSGSTGATGTLLQQYGTLGSGSVSFTSAPGQTVSVVFTSDLSVVANGFSLTVNYSGAPVASTAPTSATASPTGICPGGSTTLTVTGGTLGTGATYQWYAGGCGVGTAVGTGASITVSPTTTTTYFARVEACGVPTACVSTTVTVGTASTDPTGITGSTTICSGSSTTLTVQGGSLGSGANWQWYSGACGTENGGTSIGSGPSITGSPSSTTTYYVRAEGTCNTTACVNVTVFVNPAAEPTVTGDNDICEGSTTTLDGGIGYNAYSWSTGETTQTIDVSTSGVYIVTVTDINGCTGFDGINVTVNANPTPTIFGDH